MKNNKPTSTNTTIPAESIESKILLIRGKKVMLDRDLAELYEVEIKVLNQAVKRNLKRFPEDFMFRLTKEEIEKLKIHLKTLSSDTSLRSQNVTLKRGQHRKYAPYVFTEQGVTMLSCVLNSERAIHVNIQIIRTFTKLREMLNHHKELKEKIEKMEQKYDYQFKVVFEAIKQLLDPPLEDKPKTPIGFHAQLKEVKNAR